MVTKNQKVQDYSSIFIFGQKNVQFSFSENGLGKNNRGFYIYYRFSYLKKQNFISLAE
jgi:hypothetical protein